MQKRERRQKKSETFADVICERIATARKKVVVAVADKKNHSQVLIGSLTVGKQEAPQTKEFQLHQVRRACSEFCTEICVACGRN